MLTLVREKGNTMVAMMDEAPTRPNINKALKEAKEINDQCGCTVEVIGSVCGTLFIVRADGTVRMF